MTYFLAPLLIDWSIPFDSDDGDDGWRQSFPTVAESIDWEQVRLAGERATVALNSQDLETLIEDTRDAIVQDRWAEFTRKYYCVKMRPDLTPLSKPEDSPVRLFSVRKT